MKKVLSCACILLLSFLLVGNAHAETNVTFLPDEGKMLFTSSNGTSWIKMDPISDRIVGDQFVFKGITNLPVGSIMAGQIITACFHSSKYDSFPPKDTGGRFGTGFVLASNYSDLNRFTITLDTTTVVSTIFGYSISDNPALYISSIKGDGEFILFPNSTREKLRSLQKPPAPSREKFWIYIDPPQTGISDYRTVNSHFTINGSTNLPLGANISYSIFSDGAIGGCQDHTSIETTLQGENQKFNRFFVDVNASGLDRGIYWVTLWNPQYNASVPNDFLSASTSFYLINNLSVPPPTTAPPASPSAFVPCAAVIVAGMMLMEILRKRKRD